MFSDSLRCALVESLHPTSALFRHLSFHLPLELREKLKKMKSNPNSLLIILIMYSSGHHFAEVT